MLSVRRGQQTCQSCRLQLLTLFEHGFTTTSPRSLTQRRNIPIRGLHSRTQLSRSFSTSRRFQQELETSSKTTEKSGDDLSKAEVITNINSIEEIVRHARQTFGETLPRDFLSAEEYKLYERLYGPPVRETTGEDLEFLAADEGLEEDMDGAKNVLLKENADGEFEEVEFDGDHISYAVEELEDGSEVLDVIGEIRGEETLQVQAQSQREVDAILRLQKDMDAAAAKPVEEEEDVDEEFEEEEEEEEDMEEEEEDKYEDEPDALFSGEHSRTHPHTMVGRWGTSPSTLHLPETQFIAPITELLARTNNKHLSEAAERAFGGPGLPYSSSTPGSKKLLPQKHIGLEAGQHRMSEIEADAYIAGVMPGVYAAVTGTLVEVRKRLGSNWIRDLLFREGGEGPRVLDAGAAGAGLLAWRQIVQAEWDVLREEGIVSGQQAPDGKSTILTGPTTLRDRMSRLLNNTTFLPRLPDYIHSSKPEKLLHGAPAQGRKIFDVIIAPHTLFPLKEDFRRKNMVQNLWQMLDPKGGVLILLEKGLPRGFEAIAGARAMLLNNHIASATSTHRATPLDSPTQEQFVEKEQGMIIAPCTNHTACPMYKAEGLSSGRKDFCHFSQRFIRPPFLQTLLGAKLRNHEDVKFSYLAVRRGIGSGVVQGDAATDAAFKGHETEFDAEDGQDAVYGRTELRDDAENGTLSLSPRSLPRAILPPLKRRGHVTLDLCTPSGTIERWTVPKSFSNQAYRDARKSKHGDLWALGAKTRTVRNVRLGKVAGKDDGEVRKGKKGERLIGKDGKKGKKNVYQVDVGETGMEGIRELKGGKVDRGKRTRGGRVERKTRDLMEELGGMESDADFEDDDIFQEAMKEMGGERKGKKGNKGRKGPDM